MRIGYATERINVPVRKDPSKNGHPQGLSFSIRAVNNPRSEQRLCDLLEEAHVPATVLARFLV